MLIFVVRSAEALTGASAVRVRMHVAAGGLPSSTDFEVLARRALPGGVPVALIACRPRTGRQHQIRAHLKAIDHPVVGDPEYGRAGALGLGRQFLHAEHLAFEHPVTGAAVDVRSPLPADLAEALRSAS